MNTRLFLTTLVACICLGVATAQQGVNPAIQEKLESFIKYSNDKNWDSAFDLLYPKLFTKVEKRDLIDLMNGMESDGMELRMDNTKMMGNSAPVEEGNETFVRVDYESDLTVKIKQGGMYDAPKAIQALDEQFRATYGKNAVKWSDRDKAFAIHARKAMMAVDPGNGDWKLVEINMDQPQLMESLFSPSIMEALVRVQ